jgi:hypothetical protein
VLAHSFQSSPDPHSIFALRVRRYPRSAPIGRRESWAGKNWPRRCPTASIRRLLDTYDTHRQLAAERRHHTQLYAVRAHAPRPRNHSSKTTFRRNQRAHSGETSGRHHVGQHCSLPNLATRATACSESSCRHQPHAAAGGVRGSSNESQKTVAEMASGATPVTGIALTRASTTWLYTIGVLTTVGWIVFARIW